MRWALLITGVIGLLAAVITLLGTLTEFLKSITAYHIMERLPAWAQWIGAPPSGAVTLIAGVLCGLLLVAGRWPVKLLAVLVAVWFLYAHVEFGSGSSLARQVAQTFEYAPFYHGALVSVAALVAAALCAIVLGALSPRMGRALSAADEPRP
jgi:hypothetical protein